MNKIQKIIKWIEMETGLKYGEDWSASENMLEAGLLDSLKLMRLLVYIEEVIGVELDDEKISYKHLISVNDIEAWYFSDALFVVDI